MKRKMERLHGILFKLRLDTKADGNPLDGVIVLTVVLIYIDDYNYKGERRRTWLDISYEKALTQAEDDIKRNWELYRDQFFQGRFPSHE